ncbi:zinc knuckle CX2CX4HX4C containing protein [Tanacetum coccineum]
MYKEVKNLPGNSAIFIGKREERLMWAVPVISDISRGPTSSTEAEYIAASKETVWIRKFISGLGVVPTNEEPIPMYYDNIGAIIIANEPRIIRGAKHFRTKVHYLREVIELGDIRYFWEHWSGLNTLIRALASARGRNNFNLREENTNRGNLEELRVVMKSSSGAVLEAQQRMATRVSLNPKSGVTCDVPLTTVGDLHKLINDIEAGKHDELLSEMTNDDRMETLDALSTICNSIQANNINSDVIPYKVSHVDDLINLNVDESIIPSDPIVQSVDINTKSTSYVGFAGASAKDQPKVNSNFRILVADPVFDGVNISIPHKIVEKVSTRFEHTLYGYFMGKRMAFLVVEYYTRNNWAKHGLKRIMMNSKGFFFFKFDSRAGLEAVLEGGPWLIRKSLIILKKWSMDTRLVKEELTRISIWVKLHDVPIQFFEDDGRSSFARCLIEVNSEADLGDIVTIGITSLYGDGFTKETIRVEYEWRPPIYDIFKIFGHVHDHCPKKGKKRKGKSKSTNGGQFASPSVKQNVRYEPKDTTSAPNKGVTNVGNTSQSSSMLKTTDNSSKKDNLSMSNSFSALNDEEEDDEEDVENVYDESANLIQTIKAGGSSYFTAAVG